MLSEQVRVPQILDKRSPIPLYHQLNEILRTQITTGAFKSGGRFLSEGNLQDRYGVSRVTIRRALSGLVDEGLLVREQGRGSFVATPRLEDQLRYLTSFTEDAQLHDLETDTQVLDFRVVQDAKVARKMKLRPEEQLIKLQRIRSANKEPIALQTAFVRLCYCPQLVERGLIDGSLYKTLEIRYALRLGHARQTLEARPADEYEAKLLGINKGLPALTIERVTYLTDESPVEYVYSVYRGDRYRYTVELKRRHVQSITTSPQPREGGSEG